MSHIAIIGAGVVGCASAYALSRLGHRVSVVDSIDSAAQVCSKANAGQLSYQFAEPMASPKILKTLPGLLLNADSPVHWNPRLSPKHWLWLLDFLRACRAPVFESSLQEQIRLAMHSQNVFQTWTQENPTLLTGTDYSTPGKLIIYGTKNSAQEIKAALQRKGTLDTTQFLIDTDTCKALEPALSHRTAAELSFGVWTPSEAVIDGEQWAIRLLHASGASRHLGQTARRLHRQADGTTAVALSGGDTLVADHVVVAAGLATPGLLDQWQLRHRLRLEGLRGCSLTAPVTDADRALRVSVTELDRKIVYSRIGARIRIAGFADLGQAETAVPARRFDTLSKHLHRQCSDTVDMHRVTPWCGFRPSTPKSPPSLGRLPGRHSVWINAGHGALGLTLAAGCADLLARALSGQANAQDRAIYTAPHWLA